MIKIYKLLLLAIIVSNCTNKIALNTLQTTNLKGKVKSVHSKVYSATEKNGKYIKQEEQKGTFSGNNIIFYNKKGYKTEYNNFDDFHKFYEFNNNGLLKLETKYYSNGEIQGKTKI